MVITGRRQSKSTLGANNINSFWVYQPFPPFPCNQLSSDITFNAIVVSDEDLTYKDGHPEQLEKTFSPLRAIGHQSSAFCDHAILPGSKISQIGMDVDEIQMQVRGIDPTEQPNMPWLSKFPMRWFLKHQSATTNGLKRRVQIVMLKEVVKHVYKYLFERPPGVSAWNAPLSHRTSLQSLPL